MPSFDWIKKFPFRPISLQAFLEAPNSFFNLVCCVHDATEMCPCMCGVCVVYVWCMCGVCVVYVWCMCGVCVVYVWCMCGVCVVYVWCMCGVCVVYV